MRLINLFRRKVKDTPNRIAVFSNTRVLTYQDLDHLSNKICSFLISKTIKEIIPIHLNYDINILPVVLGILKSGKTILPIIRQLDFDKSINRINDLDFDLVISDTVESNTDRDFSINNIEDIYRNTSEKIQMFNERKIKSDNNNVYIICTSGTTGNPKKIAIDEKRLYQVLNEYYKIVNFNKESIFLLSTPYTFDVSLTEIFSPIVGEGMLYCLDDSSDKFELIHILNGKKCRRKVSHLSLSPSYTKLLLDIEGQMIFDHLYSLSVAGEPFSIGLAKSLFPVIENGLNVFNFYGPSETTIYATYHKLNGKEEGVVPIGKPIEGFSIHILDKNNNKVKGNAIGEIVISGVGVNSGYIGNQELTSKLFFEFNNKLSYKTGDFANYNKEGEIVFKYRKDHQVNINGVRIELAEIADLVQSIEKIIDVKVNCFENKIYVFYIAQSELRKEIQSVIPTYIKPIIIKVDQFELNSNRKLDYKKMRERYLEYNTDQQPDNEVNQIMTTITDLLKQYKALEIDDLDSLDKIRFFMDIEDEFDVSFSEYTILELHTVEKLLRFLLYNKTNFVVDGFMDSSDHSSLINLRYILDNYYYGINDKTIEASCSQKSLIKKNKTSVDWLDIKFSDNDRSKIISNLKKIFLSISERIDFFKLYGLIQGRGFFLKQSICIDPIVLAVENFPNEKELVNLVYSYKRCPIYLVLYSDKLRLLRIYFFYHSLDASSKNLLENCLNKVFRQELLIGDLPESSFGQYMEYIRTINESLSDQELLQLVPKSNKIPLESLSDNQVWMASFECYETTTRNITLSSIYCISKCLFSSFSTINSVTGQIAYTIRDYYQTTLNNTIGDIHATIPFEIFREDSWHDFIRSFEEILDRYRKGIDLKYCYYDVNRKDSEYYVEFKKYWSQLNISFNYIGEILDIRSIIDEIKSMSFKQNYITIFSHRKTIYLVCHGNILPEGEYSCVKDDQNVLVRCKLV